MSLFDCIKNPVIKTKRLVIDDITPYDKPKYFELYTDEKLNKYWGYDYKEDLKDKPLTVDYFYDFMTSLKNNKEEYSLAIRNNGEFIGEAVFHNFSDLGQVEIGFRIFEKYQNKGFATETCLAMINYIKRFNPKKIIAKCYLENLPSKKVLLKAGFNTVSQDNTYFYFSL